MKLEDDALKLLQSMKRTDGPRNTRLEPSTALAIERLEQAGLIKGTPANSSDVIYTLLPAAEEHLSHWRVLAGRIRKARRDAGLFAVLDHFAKTARTKREQFTQGELSCLVRIA